MRHLFKPCSLLEFTRPVLSTLFLTGILTSAAVAGSFYPAFAFSEPGETASYHSEEGRHHHDPTAYLSQDLTPEQQQKLKAIRESVKPQVQSLMTQSREKKMALKQYMMSAEAKEATALGMQKDLDVLHSRLGELKIQTWFQIKQNLTPEQLQKLKAHHEEMKAKYQQRRSSEGTFGKRQTGGSNSPKSN